MVSFTPRRPGHPKVPLDSQRRTCPTYTFPVVPRVPSKRASTHLGREEVGITYTDLYRPSEPKLEGGYLHDRGRVRTFLTKEGFHTDSSSKFVLQPKHPDVIPETLLPR